MGNLDVFQSSQTSRRTASRPFARRITPLPLVAALALCAIAGSARASVASSAAGPPVGEFYLALAAGPWWPGETILIKRTTAGATGLVRIGYQAMPQVALEFEAIAHGATYTGPMVPPDPLGLYKRQRDLTVNGFALSVRGSVPAGRFEPYARAGIGFFTAKLRENFQDTSWWTFEDTETASGAAPLAAAGVNVTITRKVFLGAEARRSWMRQDFGDLGGGSLEAGGTSVLATFGWRLGPR